MLFVYKLSNPAKSTMQQRSHARSFPAYPLESRGSESLAQQGFPGGSEILPEHARSAAAGLNETNSVLVESADKPGSVVDSHSSRPAVASRLKQPTRERRGPRHAPLFGLAPGGVCLATRRCPRARCALTAPFHHHLIPCGPSAVCSLLHFPSAHAAQALPGTLPYGARTFLEALARLATVWPTPPTV